MQSKPADIREKIVEGQLRKWYQQVVLYEQPFRDTDQTVGQLITDAIARIGENIRVRRFDALPARGGAVTDGPTRGRRQRSARDARRYHRILLKLSGEALHGVAHVRRRPGRSASSSPTRSRQVQAAGVEVAIVVGGGNIFRGLAAAARGMERATGDYMGMLATVMNAPRAPGRLEKAGVPDPGHVAPSA